jgi:four helix bundle protein
VTRGEDINIRLTGFAVNVIRLCARLSGSPAGAHIANQLMRSGTSCAANYAEVRGAESRKDFIHKLAVVLKELNESLSWLTMAEQSGLVPSAIVHPLADECDQLCRIISASIQTASGRKKING